jgi:hypothetical protein
MKIDLTLSAALLVVLALCGPGCRRQAATDATQPLQKSFQAAEPEVQLAVAKVSTQMKAGQYAEATRTLAPVVSGRPLSEAQKQAVGMALRQINQSIAANPTLDTKEMYEMRARMFHAVHNSGRRF